jgi:hypothetical protein
MSAKAERGQGMKGACIFIFHPESPKLMEFCVAKGNSHFCLLFFDTDGMVKIAEIPLVDLGTALGPYTITERG